MDVSQWSALAAVLTPLVVLVYQVGRLVGRVEDLERRQRETRDEVSELRALIDHRRS